MRTLSLFVLLISLISFSSAALNNGIILDPTTNYKIQWELINQTSIIIAVSADVEAWIGIGWHCPNCSTQQPMQNADLVVGTFDSNGIISVNDYMTGSTGPPPVPDTSKGGVDNIISYGGYQSPGKSYMIFSRPLVTGDKIGDQDLTLDGSVYFIWAHGKTNTFAAHGPGNAGFTKISLTASSSSQPSSSGGPSPPDYVSWHASLMFLAFGILMPFGIFAGRFLKGYDWWFPLHYILQGVTFTCALVAFILIIVFVDGFDFSTIHSIFGIITLCFVVLVVAGGVTSHLMWKPNRTETPIFPDIIHHWGGRIVYLLATATIITGMVLHQIPTASIIVFSGFVTFLFSIFIFIEIYKRKYPQKFDDETHRLIN